MTLKKYNKTNFHKHTFCEFIEVDTNAIPNIEWHYKSKSGSGYCFTEQGVYRISNHWGRAANCRWRLISSASSNTSSRAKINNSQHRIGYAKWTDFYPNNETEKLFPKQAGAICASLYFCFIPMKCSFSKDKN